MPIPFPGMDPYLEHPALWPDVHNSLIAAVRAELSPILKPRYVVRLEERTYVSELDGLMVIGMPDISIDRRRRKGAEGVGEPREGGAMAVQVPLPDRAHEIWLEVRRAGTGEVVTVLELLSPSNKSPAGGKGRRTYERKRMAVLGSPTHLVEVDLLRHGDPMPVYGTAREKGYRILVSRGDRRPRADLFLFTVRDPIPTFRLPLLTPDEEPEIDLGNALRELYDHVAYDLSIDYRAEPVPPLPDDDRQWADSLLRKAGHR